MHPRPVAYIGIKFGCYVTASDILSASCGTGPPGGIDIIYNIIPTATHCTTLYLPNYIFVVYYIVPFFFVCADRVNKQESRRIGARVTNTKN